MTHNNHTIGMLSSCEENDNLPYLGYSHSHFVKCLVLFRYLLPMTCGIADGKEHGLIHRAYFFESLFALRLPVNRDCVRAKDFSVCRLRAFTVSSDRNSGSSNRARAHNMDHQAFLLSKKRNVCAFILVLACFLFYLLGYRHPKNTLYNFCYNQR